MNIDEQDIAVSDYLKSIDVKYQVIPVQQGAKSDDDWEHDKWLCIFNGQSFEYSTGTGHRIPLVKFQSFGPKLSKQLKQLKAIIGMDVKQRACFQAGDTHKDNPHKRMVVADIRPTYAVMPTQASVLYSLLLDAQCGVETFNDFCDNFGYDNDSIKAQKIYFACQENTEKLRKVFNSAQIAELETLLEDY